MLIVPKDAYVPKEIREFFDAPTVTIQQAQLFETYYFGRNVSVASPHGSGLKFFIDFRLEVEDCLKAVPKDLEKQQQEQLKQVIKKEREDFDYELFRRLNRFHQFIDWAWEAVDGSGMKNEYNLKLRCIDLIGRTFVIFNATPSNEWARLSCMGHKRCYYARQRFLFFLRKKDVDRLYSDYLEVGKAVEA